MQSSAPSVCTPQKAKPNNAGLCSPDIVPFRLEDASPETERVIYYLHDLKQKTRRTNKPPHPLPFSVKENISINSKKISFNTLVGKGTQYTVMKP